VNTSEFIKNDVRERYNRIALQDKSINAASCCGAGPVSGEVYTVMSDSYEGIEGHVAEADLGLGCGLPVQYALISAGDTVIDLGSGAGNDAFIARSEVGETGSVYGIDFSPNMLEKARKNAQSRGFSNVYFIQADIDHVPLADQTADVVVSNCVLNLLPEKDGIFGEIFRLLKPGGHFSVSDVVRAGELPEALLREAELYAGCVSGASERSEYLGHIARAGFENIQIQKEKVIALPDDILARYLSADQVKAYSGEGLGLFSITVFAQKPGGTPKTAQVAPKARKELSTLGQNCAPGSGCC
jgi:ubiquinone/menaquinone biosynthesis C-methylase UbiE